MTMTATRIFLPISAVIAILCTIATSTFAFRTVPSIGIKNHAARIPSNFLVTHKYKGRRVHRCTTTLILSSPDDNAPRNNEPASIDARPVPLFGEIDVDGSLIVLVPAAVISILGFIFSIVVALNSGDAIVQSEVDPPDVTNIPTVVEESKCRGLCSSQDENLDGMRNFMESISRKD